MHGQEFGIGVQRLNMVSDDPMAVWRSNGGVRFSPPNGHPRAIGGIDLPLTGNREVPVVGPFGGVECDDTLKCPRAAFR
ncbi:MAG: hypothetical protein RIS35_1622 [Pseudomonadota bacterium]|jgi:hypothetical protein